MTQRTAIQDARALLETFLASDCQDMFVSTDDTLIFIAKASGRPSPMLSPQLSARVDAATVERSINAPHVATLYSIQRVGTPVSAGGSVAVLQLLCAEINVVAPEDGIVGRHLALPGDLLEFGVPILTLRAGAD